MIWQEIRKLEGQQLKTLAKGNVFEVRQVTDEVVTVFLHSSKKVRFIYRSEIEGPFNDLWLENRLNMSNIRNMHSEANPTYVAALLAGTPKIRHSLNPIEIWLERDG